MARTTTSTVAKIAVRVARQVVEEEWDSSWQVVSQENDDGRFVESLKESR